MLIAVEPIMTRHAAVIASIMRAISSADPAWLHQGPPGRWRVRDVLIHLGNCAEAAAVDLAGFRTGVRPQREYLPADEWNAQQLRRFAHLDDASALAYFLDQSDRMAKVASAITDEELESVHPFLAVFSMTVDHAAGHVEQVQEALAAARSDQRAAQLHALAYSRSQVLAALNPGQRPAAALAWRPSAGRWSALEHAIHLAIRDRHVAAVIAAKADGNPPAAPFPEGELDTWNRDTVAALGWMSLTEVLHDLGLARGDLTAQLDRLSSEQLAAETEGLRAHAQHDRHHATAIRRTLRAWASAARQ